MNHQYPHLIISHMNELFLDLQVPPPPIQLNLIPNSKKLCKYIKYIIDDFVTKIEEVVGLNEELC